jgi:hypothetical protein
VSYGELFLLMRLPAAGGSAPEAHSFTGIWPTLAGFIRPGRHHDIPIRHRLQVVSISERSDLEPQPGKPSIMKIENFTENLRAKINDADKRLKVLVAPTKTAGQKAQAAAKAQLAKLEDRAKQQRAQVEASEAKVKAWADRKKTETEQRIAEWKAQRQTKKLVEYADGAESYAAAAIEIAVAAIDEAERAVVEAVGARMDADAAAAPATT